MDNSVIVSLIVDMQTTNRTLGTWYVDWYIFFFMLNLGALTWVFASTRDEPPTGSQRLISGTFVAFNIAAAINSIVVLLVFLEFDESANSAIRYLLNDNKIDAELTAMLVRESSSLFYKYRIFAMIAHCFSFVLIAIIWFILGFRRKK